MNKPIKPVREGFQPEQTPAAVSVTEAESVVLPEIWPMVVKLQYRPIVDPTYGEIRELKLRQPTAGDLNRIGVPLKMDDKLRFVIDEQKMHAIIGALSGTLTPLLDQMDPRDWHAIAWKLFRFFLPSSAAWD
jgi:Phage tail assembly chaperone proteins, E, or 41 or 14